MPAIGSTGSIVDSVRIREVTTKARACRRYIERHPLYLVAVIFAVAPDIEPSGYGLV